jgi:hypothetical protein
MPAKRYIVRMSKEERDTLQEIVKKLKGTSEKVRRAQILLKADAGADGPRWPDSQIADAFDCSVRSVELIRERLVLCHSRICGYMDFSFLRALSMENCQLTPFCF